MPFGSPRQHLSVTGSTNTDARRWAAEGAPEGALVIADQQTDGRGRSGRVWLSEPGSALLFSLVLRPRLSPDRLGLLTTAIGVGVAEGVEDAAPGLRCGLKWPNDVIVNQRKLAGILVESVLTRGRVDAAVAGVGVNLAWGREQLPDEIAARATSLAIECEGRPPGGDEVLDAILRRVEAAYDELHGDPAAIVRRAAERSVVIGTRVTFRSPTGEAFEGLATRLLEDGALEIEVDGRPRAVHAGEVARLIVCRDDPRTAGRGPGERPGASP